MAAVEGAGKVPGAPYLVRVAQDQGQVRDTSAGGRTGQGGQGTSHHQGPAAP